MKLKTRKTYDYIFIYLFILICYYYLVLEFAQGNSIHKQSIQNNFQ